MSKLLMTVWILVLANSVIAFTGLILSNIFYSIIGQTILGGDLPLPELTGNFILHEGWFCAVFTVPLILAAVNISVRGAITVEGTLLFGAVTILNITLQASCAATALSQPFVPVSNHRDYLPSVSLPLSSPSRGN